ncbi:unnamed protein product, partial [Ectocarpus sp. 4 AP-2014]
GAAWLSSARAVSGTAGANREEGGDDVKSSRPLRPGLHTCYNGRYRGKPPRKGARIYKTAGIASNRISAMIR